MGRAQGGEEIKREREREGKEGKGRGNWERETNESEREKRKVRERFKKIGECKRATNNNYFLHAFRRFCVPFVRARENREREKTLGETDRQGEKTGKGRQK